MARRYGLSWYVGLIVAAAVFVKAPMDTLEVSWTVFQAIGEFGGQVVSELASDDSGAQ